MKTLIVTANLISALLGAPVSADTSANNTAATNTGSLETMRFDHMSINVANFEQAMIWYQEKLGFTADVSWRVEALNGKRLAYLSLGDTVIELVAADEGGVGLEPAKSFPEHFGRTGFGHLCFIVENVDAALATLRQRGVPTFVHAETYALDGTPYQRRVGFIQDPEGNVIEFAEALSLRKK